MENRNYKTDYTEGKYLNLMRKNQFLKVKKNPFRIYRTERFCRTKRYRIERQRNENFKKARRTIY